MNSGITRYENNEGWDLTQALTEQQDGLLRLLMRNQAIQKELLARQEQQEERIAIAEEQISRLGNDIREQRNAYSLITINMLDTMLNAGWSEKEKNRIGTKLANYSRSCKVQPTKVPHPTLPNGVNAYQPSIVKAWLLENNYVVPADLRYVD